MREKDERGHGGKKKAHIGLLSSLRTPGKMTKMNSKIALMIASEDQ
jgi:hypothetical protein